jgi:glutamate racemase
MNGDTRPIGIFDSGVGGLSLLRELDVLMPYEDFIYVGDTARIPYGAKTEQQIISYSHEIMDFLRRRDCKMIIIACNTVTGMLTERDHIECEGAPVVGIINYGCITAALYVTYNFRIGIWGTQLTIDSGLYKRYMDNIDPTVRLFAQPCTELVALIEQGAIGSPDTRDLTENYLRPMLREDIDTLVLACTHLPFIRGIIQDIVTAAVTLIDPARRTAVLCMKVLTDNRIARADRCELGRKQFYVTGDPDLFKETGRLLVGRMVDTVEKVDLSS